MNEALGGRMLSEAAAQKPEFLTDLVGTVGSISSAWVGGIGLSLMLILGYALGSSNYTESSKRWNWFTIVKTELKE